MLQSGDSFVHFTKVRSVQMAQLRSVMEKRPKAKFSLGLSAEAQEAMQQAIEETKIAQNARKGKRGSKGNVLFSDTVQIRQDAFFNAGSNKPAFLDIYEDTSECGTPRTPRRSTGRRRSSVSKWVGERRSSLVGSETAVDEVLEANRALTSPGNDATPSRDWPSGEDFSSNKT